MTAQRKVLFVDDDTSLNQIMEKILREHGFEVDVASDGVQALERLRTGSYDVAVLDNYLPNVNGIEILRQIRLNNLVHKVIMITAVDEYALARESRRLGVDEILAKPFDFERLISLIRSPSARQESQPGS